MNYERLIKKEFKFLEKMNFGVKNNTFGPDVYISYLNFYKDICINISVYEGVKCSIEDTKPKKSIAVTCSIESITPNEYIINTSKKNILNNTVFNKEKTVKLNEEILKNINSVEEQIKIYAQFIFENIGEIIKD